MYDQMFNILIKSSLNFNVASVKDLVNWNQSSDQGAHYDALLTDSPKAFDCMIHDLFIVKLQAYSFDNDFLNFNCNYLLTRK